MLFHEVMQKTGLTRKAIEYYQLKGLIQPDISDNGYRHYSERDVDKLKHIAFLRGLDLNLADIEKILEGSLTVSDLLRRQQLQRERHNRKGALLEAFEKEGFTEGLQEELEAILREESIEQRLNRLFPDYFAQLMMMNLQSFIQDPLQSAEQERSFQQLVDFLDQLPALEVDPAYLSAMEEASKEISYDMMKAAQQAKWEAIHHPEAWIDEHRRELEDYHALTQSQAYREHPVVQFSEKLRQFMQEHRFHEVMTPLMRKMSPSYDAYYEAMIRANDLLMEEMPEWMKER